MAESNQGWNEYFEKQDIQHTFAGQKEWYDFELWHLLNSNSVLKDKANKGAYVLGGFFPARDNVDAFNDIAQKFDPSNAQGHTYYVDIHADPLKVLTPGEQTNFRQLDLRNIAQHFSPNSIDFIALDHVVQFMDDKGAEELFRGLAQTLTPEGVAMMTLANPGIFPWLEKRALKKAMHVEVYPRKPKERDKLITPHLKITSGIDYRFEKGTASLYTLSRKDSPYQAFEKAFPFVV